MCTRAHQIQVITVDLIDQQPIRFHVTVALVLPWSREGVVLVVRWKRVSFGQQQDKLPELRHIFAPPLGQLDVTTELAAAN